jgi:tRNA(Ile)-lysidine synthase
VPFGLTFVIEYDRYVLAKDSASLCHLPTLDGETALNIPGLTRVPGWDILAAVLPLSAVKAAGAKDADFSAYFDFSRTGSDLTVRSRRPGDRFQPLGMTGVKKLNRFMIDARIPQSWRRRVPVVASPAQIIWVVGYRVDGRVRVAGATSKVLRVDFKPTS